jgi:hypothetical protein
MPLKPTQMAAAEIAHALNWYNMSVAHVNAKLRTRVFPAVRLRSGMVAFMFQGLVVIETKPTWSYMNRARKNAYSLLTADDVVSAVRVAQVESLAPPEALARRRKQKLDWYYRQKKKKAGAFEAVFDD